MRTTLFSMLAIALSLPAAVGDDEKSLLLYEENHGHKAGTWIVEDSAMKMKTEEMTVVVGDQKIDASTEANGVEKIHIHYLTENKIRHLMVTGLTTRKDSFGGQAQPEGKEKDVMEGIPVLLEKKDGTWSARFEKGKPNEEQREELEDLAREYNHDEDEALYGSKPRKIGESWTVDADKLPGFDEGEVKGKVKLTLTGERQYRGMRCAILKGSLNATFKTDDADEDDNTSIRLKGEVELLRALDRFDDVKFEFAGEMKISGERVAPNGPIRISAKGPFAFTGTRTFGKPEEKKPKVELD